MRFSRLLILYASLCFSFLSCQQNKKTDVSEHLEKMPTEDKIKIEAFFRYLTWDSQFAYTLFGEKPISFTCYPKFFRLNRLLHQHHVLRLEGGWKAWEKYVDLFPLQHFALFEREEGSYKVVYLVNKKCCLRKIEEHLLEFQDVLKVDYSADQFLERILSADNIFKDALGGNHFLYGILLGYGSQNSRKFDEFYRRNLKFFFPSPSFSNQEYLMLTLSLPSFASFSDSETALLQKSYSKDRENISAVYQEGNFLEVTLQKLTH